MNFTHDRQASENAVENYSDSFANLPLYLIMGKAPGFFK